MFWVPQPGRVGMGVSIISYAGEAVVGLALILSIYRNRSSVDAEEIDLLRW